MASLKIQALSDSELADAAAQFYAVLDAAPATYGATPTQADDFKVTMDGYVADLTEHLTAKAQAQSKTSAKEASRDALETAIRFLVKQAKLNNTSDADLAAAGVPVGPESALPSTATRPTGIVDTSERFRHTIKFADEAAPDIKRLPRAVLGCEIYQKVGGTAPTDVSECIFLSLDTKTPYVWEFEAEDVGKMVHYMLRWRLRDESGSAWGETISATVTG